MTKIIERKPNNLYRIAYLELDTHAEITLQFIRLNELSVNIEMDFFLSDKIIKQTDYKTNHSIFLCTPNNVYNKLVSQNNLTPYDLVIIGTVHRYFTIYKRITENFHSTFIIHNKNFHLRSRWVDFKSIFQKDTLFRLKLLLKEGLLLKKTLYQNVNQVLVLDQNLADKKHRYLPIFYTMQKNLEKNANIKIVIPGSVDQNRRDYELVIQKIRNFHKEILYSSELSPEKIDFYFLGKASGSLLSEIKKLKEDVGKIINIYFFDSKISNSDFEKIINSADFLWSPIHLKTQFFSGTETYGKTKMPGIIGDAIASGKIVFIHNKYTSKYAWLLPVKESIAEMILEYQQLDTYCFYTKYSEEKIVQGFENQLLNILKTSKHLL